MSKVIEYLEYAFEDKDIKSNWDFCKAHIEEIEKFFEDDFCLYGGDTFELTKELFDEDKIRLFRALRFITRSRSEDTMTYNDTVYGLKRLIYILFISYVVLSLIHYFSINPISKKNNVCFDKKQEHHTLYFDLSEERIVCAIFALDCEHLKLSYNKIKIGFYIKVDPNGDIAKSKESIVRFTMFAPGRMSMDVDSIYLKDLALKIEEIVDKYIEKCD